MKKLLYLTLITPLLFSCQSESNQEQTLEQLDKTSAREVVLSSTTIGDTVLHITTQKIWSNNQLAGEKIDTLKTVKAANDTIKTPIYVTIQ
ncbi:hypothetical protein [Faecalibacter bovis]|uniref:Uncharacterized protein n=1 Tax=Faecalibacter bovis TaxID=2898187 RepID=A0ABX7XAJ6_9FLAO|nr:hypothetical protein [Faecalibacter bovis]MBS7334140.1 hypothetical protein [Weeksellaceae bacterium]QTV04919.1 hypothetical protein J9309_08925 [Faecalibacter bovis]